MRIFWGEFNISDDVHDLSTIGEKLTSAPVFRKVFGRRDTSHNASTGGVFLSKRNLLEWQRSDSADFRKKLFLRPVKLHLILSSFSVGFSSFCL